MADYGSDVPAFREGKVYNKWAYPKYIIYAEGELKENEIMRKFGISEYSTKPTSFYNLDVIISVGYRVKSQRGVQFRQWANKRIHKYIIKDFTSDDEREICSV